MDTSFQRSPAHRYHNFTLPTSIHILTRKLCAHHGFNLPVPNSIDVSDQKRLLDLDNTDRKLLKPPKKCLNLHLYVIWYCKNSIWFRLSEGFLNGLNVVQFIFKIINFKSRSRSFRNNPVTSERNGVGKPPARFVVIFIDRFSFSRTKTKLNLSKDWAFSMKFPRQRIICLLSLIH